jgi:hypothetical protein
VLVGVRIIVSSWSDEVDESEEDAHRRLGSEEPGARARNARGEGMRTTRRRPFQILGLPIMEIVNNDKYWFFSTNHDAP